MTARRLDVAFLYEYQARELDVASAVAMYLRQRKAVVEILQWPSEFARAITQGCPRLVILPYCYDDKNYADLLPYWRSARFFNMSWEQLYYLGNRKAKTPRGAFTTQYVIHHAWSGEYASFLEASGIPKKNIFLNGQPAYTLYDEPYKLYFPSRAELARRYGLDAGRRWIFFPENYNWAFYSAATLESFRRNGQTGENIRVMREFCETSLREVLDWCASVVAGGEVEIILRPRPSTPLKDFINFVSRELKEIPMHLHILREESVREWILASDVVISSHSTTLIEAALADRPVCILEPQSIPLLLQVEWHNLLPHLRTKEEFLEFCNSVSTVHDPRLAGWARRTMMSRGDAIQNLADFISGIIRNVPDPKEEVPRKVAFSYRKWVPPAWVWSVYRKVKQKVRYSDTNGVEPDYAHDVITKKAMDRRISTWKGIALRDLP